MGCGCGFARLEIMNTSISDNKLKSFGTALKKNSTQCKENYETKFNFCNFIASLHQKTLEKN